MTNVGMFKDMTYKSLNKQIDGTHYKNMKVQPAHFEKAIHYLEMILERDYS
jgi:hypothetical protein